LKSVARVFERKVEGGLAEGSVGCEAAPSTRAASRSTSTGRLFDLAAKACRPTRTIKSVARIGPPLDDAAFGAATPVGKVAPDWQAYYASSTNDLTDINYANIMDVEANRNLASRSHHLQTTVRTRAGSVRVFQDRVAFASWTIATGDCSSRAA
jgi:hypothetical protein